MKSNLRFINWFLVIILFSFLISVQISLAAEYKFVPAVPIPGTSFSSTNCVSGDNNCSVPWLAEYIYGIFKYGVIAAAILAAAMIMIAGFLWLTAGGSPNQISKAKDIISSSFLGLFLALFSTVILQTINPNLINLKALSPKGVENTTVGGGIRNPQNLSTVMRDRLMENSSWWNQRGTGSYIDQQMQEFNSQYNGQIDLYDRNNIPYSVSEVNASEVNQLAPMIRSLGGNTITIPYYTDTAPTNAELAQRYNTPVDLNNITVDITRIGQPARGQVTLIPYSFISADAQRVEGIIRIDADLSN
ncbi:MAG: hypothetical protein M1338_01645 [Patescibacteria group bacterium]|nr:hypothetical protein [Patescibacteria group bacterium]